MRLIEKSIARNGTSGLIGKNNARNRSGIWIKTLIIEISKFLHPHLHFFRSGRRSFQSLALDKSLAISARRL